MLSEDLYSRYCYYHRIRAFFFGSYEVPLLPEGRLLWAFDLCGPTTVL